MKKSMILAALSAATISTPAFAASTLYGTHYAAAQPLYIADQATGALSAVGGALANIGDLTSSGNALYGVTLGGNNSLVRIDQATGSVLSTVAITGTRAGEITSIAYDIVTGRFFGNTTPGFGDAAGDRLYQIDPLTGAAALIGAVGFSDVFGLAFDNSGKLFGVEENTGNFISIDAATGAGSLISALGKSTGWYDLAARPEDNVMFISQAADEQLYTIDLTTGSTTLVGAYNLSSNIAGLAFLSGVPEPATWAMMMAGFGCVGFSMRRRPRRVSYAV
jgi:hypothetical protein